jgi:Flp pilus assembly protein TadG
MKIRSSLYHSTRGNALPETAMVMAFISMVLLGAVRLAIVGYTQAQADGATFVAAHALARDSSATNTTVNAIVKGIFPSVSTTGSPSLSMNTANGQTYADYEPTLNLSLVPGVTASIKIRSHAVEAQLPAAQITSGSTNISVPLVTLQNYVNGTIPGVNGTTASYQFYVAQYVDASGNGKNGRFGEWYCHYTAYSNLVSDLPSVYPGSSYTMSGALTNDEKTIYKWDSTTPGAASSC